MRFRSPALALTAALVALGCPSEGGVTNVLVVARVEVTPDLNEIVQGSTIQLTATPKTTSGIVVTGRTVSWSSTDASVASVSGSGLVTGVSVGGPVRIRATVDGIVGDAVISVRPVPVDHVTVSPLDLNLLVGASQQLTATAFDSHDSPLSGRSFLWQSSDHNTATVTTTGLVIAIHEGGPVTITATAEGKTGNGTVSVLNRPPTRLGFGSQPSNATAGSPITPPITVALQDDLLSTVFGATNQITIALAANPGGATLSGTKTKAAVNGVATFSDLVLDKVGTGYTFQATAAGLVPAISNAFTLSAAGASQPSFTTPPPTAATSGGVLSPQPVIQLRDASGNIVQQAGIIVTASINQVSGAPEAAPATGEPVSVATLGGSTTATTNSSGVATFTNLSITGTAGVYTLSFSAPGMNTLTSPAITLSSGSATQLSIATQPSLSAQSNTPLPVQPQIQLKDASGNDVAQSGVVVTAAVQSSPAGGAVGGNTTATTNSSGRAVFAGLSISGPSGAYTLRFSAPGLGQVVSNSITLGAGGASRLVMGTQPSANAISGQPFTQQPTVRLQDASGNPVAQAGIQVTVTLTGIGNLGGTITKTTDASGIASFTDLSITALIGVYQLSFSASGLLPATSGDILLGAGIATKLALSQQPAAGGASGVAFTTQPVVQVQDVAGNPAAQAGIVVTAAIASGPAGATLGGTLTATTSATGAATFTNLAITGSSGTYTLQFTAASLTLVTSSSITLGAGAPTQLTITTQPSSTAQSGSALAQQPVIQLRDGSNNPVSQAGVVVTAAIATGGGTLGGTTTASTNASGVATFTNLSISGIIGTRTLSFSASGLASATSSSINLTAGAAHHLAVTTQPSSAAQSGVAFGQQPIIQLQDASNNAVSQSGVTVTAAIATGGGTLGGTSSLNTNASGVATFTNLSITGTAGDRTLSFSASGLAGTTSGTITVTAGAASQLSITTQPSSSAQSGVAFSQQPVIQLRDASNNPVSQSGVVVTASISTGGGSLGGTATATTNSSGVATFTNLSIAGTIGPRTLLFSASGFTSVTSGTITLTAGAAHHLEITTQPSTSAQSGVALVQQPVIQLRDASNNAVSQSGVAVTASIASGGGSLAGTASVNTNASGVATFTNLAISGTIGDRTLGFAASGLTGATSTAITITPGPAHHLAVTTQPSSSAQNGVVFGQQPVVQLQDASNNAVSQGGIAVVVAIGSGGGTLNGTTSVNTSLTGAASFSNLSITGTAGPRTLSFTSTGLTGATSNTVTLTAGAAHHLSITTQPSSLAQSGVAFAQQPVIQLRDVSDNAVSQSGVSVTASIASGGGSLGGTTSVNTNASGVATFTNLSISGTAGDRTLSFGSAGLTGITSGTVTISAGAASQLGITTQPSTSVQNGVAFAQQPAIQLRDASNNPVAQSGVVVSAAINTGGGTLGGTTTATTNASGLATFTDLSITGTIGDRSLVFSASGYTSVTSGTITVIAGAAHHLTMTTQPSSSAQSGVVFGQQPVLQLRDISENAVSQSGVSVTASIATGGGTLGGTTGVNTNASGVATFTNLSISGTIGARTLGFAAAGIAGVNSGTITVSAGPADHLSITTQPSSSAPSGTAFAQQPVIQLRDAANNAVSQAGVAVTASIATGGGSLGGGATVSTSASGVATFTDLSITGTAGDRTLSFSASGLTNVASGTISITAGSASNLSITTQPSSSVQNGVAFPQQPAIQLRDAGNNPVAQSGVVVTATINTGVGSLGGTTTATTNASGLATFTNLSITGTIGDRTLLFAAAGFVSVASSTITVTAGAATHLSITTQPSSSAPSGVAFGQQPVIQLRDQSENAVSQSGVSVTASIASGGGSLGGTASVSTNSSGVATFTNLSISGTIGDRTLGFAASGLTGATSSTITLTAGSASQLSITTQPSSSAQSGATFSQQPVLQLRDGAGNAVSQAGVSVGATIASGGGTLGGTTSVSTNASGVATFTNLSITGTAGNRTLGFNASGMTGATSGTINITAGSADHLSITTQPSGTVQNGVAFPQQPAIQLLDGGNNAVSQAGVVVTASIASGGGTLGGTTTATTNASGLATFTNLSITGTAGNRTLSFSASGLTGVTSGTINVTSGSADHLSITTQPSSSAQSGVAFGQQPVIQLRDASNNAVSQAGVSVSVTIASGGGSLGGTTSVSTNASGVATFTNLSISGTIGNRTLDFAASGLTGVTSGTINLTAGPAAQLSITTQPSSSAQSGATFAQQPVLQLLDGAGNTVSQSGVSVSASIASGGGTLGGTTSVSTNASGVATFTNLSITGLAGDRTLGFSASGLSGATSNTISITAGSADHLSITTQPSSTVTTGVAFPQQPAIQLRDAGNNPVAQSGVVVTAAINSGGGTLGGTATATTDGTGLATFTNLSITGTAGNRTLSFSASGLTGVTSGTINVTSGSADHLSITTQPSSSAQSGVAFSQQPVIQLRDASNNAVSQAGVSIDVTIASGGGSLGGTTTVSTNASGVATFTNLSISGTIGNRTLSFSSSGLTGVTSGTINLTAGPAAQLSITTQPSSSAQSGATFAQQPVLQLLDGAGNTVSQAGVSVTAAIASGGGTLGGTTSRTTNASGAATFTNLSITGTAGDRTLGFSASGLTGATSSTISITAGPADHLSVTTQPSASVANGAVFPQQPAIQLRDGGNNAVAQSGVVVTAAINSGGGTLGGTTTATTDATGLATFTNLSITGTAGNRTLSFSATGLTGVTSGTINVTAGTADHLSITTQPSSSAQSGVAFPQQPVIQLRDASNNAISQAGVGIDVTIASGGGTLGGTTSINTDASGVATFTNLAISGTIGNRTLNFAATGLTGVASGTINLTAGPASQLSITTEPSSSAAVAVAFAQQPVIQLLDAAGNTVSQSGVSVTATIASGGGTLGGTTSVNTNTSGVATFTNLSITGTVGDRTLGFSASGTSGATSSTISITTGAASQLSITTQPSSSVQNGVAFAQQPAIQLRDAGGNAVSQSGVVVTAAINSGGGTLGGTVTATTDGSGVATFADLSITGTIGDRTLSFSASGVSGVNSGTITVTAGAATQLGITTQPTTAATTDVVFPQQPAIQLRDGSGNAVSQNGVVITAELMTLTGGPGTLATTLTASTNASGLATFADLKITGTGTYQIRFTGTGLTEALSSTITVSP